MRRVSDDVSVLTSAADVLDFATSANAVYVIERVDKPLAQYVPARIAGARNQDGKRLPNTSCVLGIAK